VSPARQSCSALGKINWQINNVFVNIMYLNIMKAFNKR
jgi:hypothetical protein